jgi:anti-anti-sigma factor
MASQPVLYATTPYADEPRRLTAPASLLHGQEAELLPRALTALERGNLELDLSELEQIDAAGLGMLAMLHAFAVRCGHALVLSNPSEHVWGLLSLTGLDKALSTREAA